MASRPELFDGLVMDFVSRSRTRPKFLSEKTTANPISHQAEEGRRILTAIWLDFFGECNFILPSMRTFQCLAKRRAFRVSCLVKGRNANLSVPTAKLRKRR